MYTSVCMCVRACVCVCVLIYLITIICINVYFVILTLLGIPVSIATDEWVGMIMELAVLSGSDSVAVTLTVGVTLLIAVVSVIVGAVCIKLFPLKSNIKFVA